MKILFITPRFPFPPIKGDSLRVYNFIKELSAKHVIDICSFYEKNEETQNISEMNKFCRRIELVYLSCLKSYLNVFRSIFNFLPFQVNYYFSSVMKKRIIEMVDSEQYDVIHIVLQRMVPYAEVLSGKKIVVDQIDALSLNMKRRAIAEHNLFKKLIFLLEYHNIRVYEKKTRKKYDEGIVASEIDKNALDDNSINVVANGVDTCCFAPAAREKDIDLIFTGNMQYFPNVDAVVYFSRRILPDIIKIKPDIFFYVVGASPNNEVRALADNKNIFVTGFVKDIREYLNRARVFIAPLRSGSGIQNKILEAMSCGIPVVSTSYGNAGIRALNGEQIVIADNPEDMRRAIIDLLKDDEKRAKLSKNARNFVEEKYSWKNKSGQLEEVYGKLISNK